MAKTLRQITPRPPRAGSFEHFYSLAKKADRHYSSAVYAENEGYGKRAEMHYKQSMQTMEKLAHHYGEAAATAVDESDSLSKKSLRKTYDEHKKSFPKNPGRFNPKD